jgi:hypothetical protein
MRALHKRTLTELFLQKLKPAGRTYLVWDELQRGLVLAVPDRPVICPSR